MTFKKSLVLIRVLAYQFNEQDDSGVVVAEVVTNSMPSYLGLHFPATDIPSHVRDMYLHLPIRYIPTIDYKSERILPEINPKTEKQLDLSNISQNGSARTYQVFKKYGCCICYLYCNYS